LLIILSAFTLVTASIVLIGTVDLYRNREPIQASSASNNLTHSDGFELVTMATVFDGISRAETITLSAYSLEPTALVVRSLEAASDRGARVSVALSRGFGMYVRENVDTAAELAGHGVRVHVLESTTRATHMKAVILDGNLYLSDRNWTARPGEEIVLHDTIPGDRTLVERAVLGESSHNDHLWTGKAEALAAEADMLSHAQSHKVDVETESFSDSSPVFAELKSLATSGHDVDLIVAESEYEHRPSERASLHALVESGVKLCLLNSDEKFAVAGSAVWIGSANATGGAPSQIEFGVRLDDESIADKVSAQFDREWKMAEAPRAGGLTTGNP
jgi:phosphatidylserine/phosphatidylglycerophosphate/cardiolipin synthase-like enzyme